MSNEWKRLEEKYLNLSLQKLFEKSKKVFSKYEFGGLKRFQNPEYDIYIFALACMYLFFYGIQNEEYQKHREDMGIDEHLAERCISLLKKDIRNIIIIKEPGEMVKESMKECKCKNFPHEHMGALHVLISMLVSLELKDSDGLDFIKILRHKRKSRSKKR